MSDLLELVYLVLFRPREALLRLREGVPWWWAVAVFYGVYFFGQGLNLATGPEWEETLTSVVTLDGGVLTRAFFILGIPLALVFWFLEAAVWHLLAQFFGGQGRGTTLFLALGFTNLPLLIGQGAGALLRLGGQGFWSTLLVWASAIWVFVLQVMTVREVHGLSGSRALAVVLLPLAVVLLLTIISLAVFLPLIPVEIFRQLP